ncbi:hypothetical protein SAY87_025473 [Trapa incisa]|uniref:Secreted protein n=1 Tax=Trapa incisa TaxID=236973 RepID=A0AAN7GFW8_9MYRT|nr:hypothetical protein SAY87_025473 [Trapa incisa]
MSTCSFLPLTVLLVVVISATYVEAARLGCFLTSAPSTWMPLFAESQDLTPVNLPIFPERRVFGWREAKACLPKGPVHSSAPSRFVNYLPLRSSASSRCSSPSWQPSPPPSAH